MQVAYLNWQVMTKVTKLNVTVHPKNLDSVVICSPPCRSTASQHSPERPKILVLKCKKQPKKGSVQLGRFDQIVRKPYNPDYTLL